MRRTTSLALAAGICLAVGAVQLAGGIYIEAKAAVAQVLLERSWQKTLDDGEAAKPWSWADVWPVALIEVPKLSISAVVLNSVSGEAMAFGPGHMEGTPTPGAPGLSVIGGHRDTHMAFLRRLEIGDTVIVTDADGDTHHFRVEESRVVNAYKHGLDFAAGKARIALVTCWPFDALSPGGDQRYVVLARLQEKQQSPH